MDFWISYIFIKNLEQHGTLTSQKNRKKTMENIHMCSVESLAPKVLKDISFLFKM